MKIKKSVTQKVIAGNRENSGKSTGPKTRRGKMISSGNAGKHLISAKNLRFKDEEEEEAYSTVLADLERPLDVHDAPAHMMAEVLALNYLRYGRSFKLDQRIHRSHNTATDVALEAVRDSNLLGVNYFGSGDSKLGWEIRELSLTKKRGSESQTKNGPVALERGDDHHVEFQAKFANPGELVLRYQRA